MYGPERFFYDKKSYTGVHTRGGPSTVDNHRVDLKDVLDRSPADIRGVKLKASTSSWGSFRAERVPSGRGLMRSSSWREIGIRQGLSEIKLAQTAFTAGLPLLTVRAIHFVNVGAPQRTGSSKSIKGVSALSLEQANGGSSVYGPERFYYDKSSFTGTFGPGPPPGLLTVLLCLRWAIMVPGPCPDIGSATSRRAPPRRPKQH
eukprot:2344-Rhodomonas_salina.1